MPGNPLIASHALGASPRWGEEGTRFAARIPYAIALGYGASQIVRAQRERGIPTDTIVVSGGAGQSPLVRQLLADATGLTVAASTSPEPVLLGSAILGALSAGSHQSAATAMSAMSELGDIHRPQPALRAWHDKRFAAFADLQNLARRIR